MLCVRPYVCDAGEFPCGRCMPCRINRRRMWTTRIQLESRLRLDNCFATLTYRDPCPPELVPRDMALFVKRLRRMFTTRIRYFGVGEYGEKFFRPHYHLALFGVSPVHEALIDAAWDLGFIHVGDLTKDSAQYVAGYVCKKMTSEDDPRLGGRHPEFGRMSQGLGKGAADLMAKALVSPYGEVYLQGGDVPCVVRLEGKMMPLGQYLRRRTRVAIGRDSKTPTEVLQVKSLERLALTAEQKTHNGVLAQRHADSAAARIKIFNSRKKL